VATALPTDIDATFPDDGAAARKQHQQHHDTIHSYTNSHDGAADPHAVYVLKAGGSAITASAATVVPLVVRGAASQSANLLEARNDAGAVLARIAPSGGFVAPSGSIIGATNTLLTTPSATTNVLVVRGAASQSANLAEFQNSAGTVLARFNNEGRLLVAPDGTAAGTFAGTEVHPISAGNPGLVVRGVASQIGNLAEFQNSAGTVLAGIDSIGRIILSNTLGFTTATAGAASALPGNPADYVEVIFAGGQRRKIALWNI
jgi:hypothetical protein